MTHVLVADDEADIRDLVTFALEAVGFRVTAVADGAAALELLQGGGIDAVVLDNSMPVMTGLEVLEAMDDLPAEGRPALLMISAMAARADVDRARRAGADDFLSKPFEMRVLSRRVRELVADRAAGGPAPV
ncbi:response regulator [Nocardioides nanhaiensis]|uniref:Response regulatory domain-containing protein n=1 Tax=Nocardioides nanhaiensis TaxID=1476871 RepID=A0ABP8WC76_9ACTN